MASIIQSLMNVFGVDGKTQSSLLPTTQHDVEAQEQHWYGNARASDVLNEESSLFYDDNGDMVELVDLQEPPNEMELVALAYGSASNNNYRESGAVYMSDFYKDLNPRIPRQGDSKDDIVWRMDVDHPVVTVLMTRIMAQPVHRIYDQFGDQLFYRNQDLEAGVAELITMCTQNGYTVLPDPSVEDDVDESSPASEDVDIKLNG